MLTTAAAILGGALIAGVGGAVASTSAAHTAADAAKGAATENNALQRDMYATSRGDLLPYVQGGYPAVGALQHYLQLDRPASYGSTPVLPAAGAGGINAGAPRGDPAQVTPAPMASNALASYSGGGAPQPDWNAYIQQYPDVADWIAKGNGDPSLGPNQTPEQAAAYHFANSGQAEGRAGPPMLPGTGGGQGDPNAPPAPEDALYGAPDMGHRADATRADYGPAPNIGSAPGMPDLSGDGFMKSPSYQYGLTEGQRNLNASAGANGIGQSGDAAREAIKFGQNYAGTKYNDWVGQQLSQWNALRDQYNVDANRKLGQFNTDRSVTNQNFDVDTSRSDARYDTDRSYLTVRHDTRVNDLFRMAGLGAGTAGTLAGVNSSTAGAISGNNTAAADATGNAAIAGANGVNGALGNALGAYSVYAGLRTPGATTTPKAGA